MRRASLVFLALAAPVLLAAQLLPPSWLGASRSVAGVVFALLSVLVPVALIALGAAGRGDRLAAPVAWLLALLALVLEGAAVAVLALTGALAPRLAGLPPAAVAALGGFWLLPLPLVALGYGLTFRRSGPPSEDLRRPAGGPEAREREA